MRKGRNRICFALRQKGLHEGPHGCAESKWKLKEMCPVNVMKHIYKSVTLCFRHAENDTSTFIDHRVLKKVIFKPLFQNRGMERSQVGQAR